MLSASGVHGNREREHAVQDGQTISSNVTSKPLYLALRKRVENFASISESLRLMVSRGLALIWLNAMHICII